MSTLEVGQAAEQVAARYLQSFGYRLHDFNVRFKHDEIDIVMYDVEERTVVFVEVKARTQFDEVFSPAHNLTPRKRARLARAAQAWVDHYEYEGSYRTDAVFIVGDEVVQHLKDIGSNW